MKLYLTNRWRWSQYRNRPVLDYNSQITLIGISKRYASLNEFCYSICLFGFELSLWITKSL